MRLYDAVMKGPPKWLIRAAVILMVLVVGVQLGLWHERSKSTTQAIRAQLAEKDAKIDRLLIVLNDAQFDLQVERVKIEILVCESDVQHEGVWGDGGKSYGIAQFQWRTFKYLREQAGRPKLRWANKQDQLWLLDWALRNGYARYWTCYRNSESRIQIVKLAGGAR